MIEVGWTWWIQYGDGGVVRQATGDVNVLLVGRDSRKRHCGGVDKPRASKNTDVTQAVVSGKWWLMSQNCTKILSIRTRTA